MSATKSSDLRWYTCETCRWFGRFEDDSATGTCHLHPPELLRAGEEEGQHPIVGLDEGCSHHPDARAEVEAYVAMRVKALLSEHNPMSAVLNRKADTLELSVRSAAAIERCGAVYVGDVCKLTDARLMRQPGIGPKSVNEIREVLDDYGLTLGMRLDDWRRPK